MKKIFTKKYKKDLLDYGKHYYNAEKQSHKPNPDFEKCKQKDYEYLRCNTCEFKYDCNEGETMWVENKNIIEDLINKIIKAIESKEKRLLQEVKNK